MRVRCLQDGHYGGYYRYGPINSESGFVPGEVFEISDEKFILKDGNNNPIPEMIEKQVTQETWKPIYDKSGNVTFDKNGTPLVERDKPIIKKEMVQAVDEKGNAKFLTGSWFAPEWMERVPDNTACTYRYPPFQIPVHYRKVDHPDGLMEAVPDFKIPIPLGAPGRMAQPNIFS